MVLMDYSKRRAATTTTDGSILDNNNNSSNHSVSNTRRRLPIPSVNNNNNNTTGSLDWDTLLATPSPSNISGISSEAISTGIDAGKNCLLQTATSTTNKESDKQAELVETEESSWSTDNSSSSNDHQDKDDNQVMKDNNQVHKEEENNMSKDEMPSLLPSASLGPPPTIAGRNTRTSRRRRGGGGPPTATSRSTDEQMPVAFSAAGRTSLTSGSRGAKPALFKRCETSELVKEHRNRRPTILVEMDDLDVEDMDDISSDEEEEEKGMEHATITEEDEEEEEHHPQNITDNAATKHQEQKQQHLQQQQQQQQKDWSKPSHYTVDKKKDAKSSLKALLLATKGRHLTRSASANNLNQSLSSITEVNQEVINQETDPNDNKNKPSMDRRAMLGASRSSQSMSNLFSKQQQRTSSRPKVEREVSFTLRRRRQPAGRTQSLDDSISSVSRFEQSLEASGYNTATTTTTSSSRPTMSRVHSWTNTQVSKDAPLDLASTVGGNKNKSPTNQDEENNNNNNDHPPCRHSAPAKATMGSQSLTRSISFSHRSASFGYGVPDTKFGYTPDKRASNNKPSFSSSVSVMLPDTSKPETSTKTHRQQLKRSTSMSQIMASSLTYTPRGDDDRHTRTAPTAPGTNQVSCNANANISMDTDMGISLSATSSPVRKYQKDIKVSLPTAQDLGYGDDKTPTSQDLGYGDATHGPSPEDLLGYGDAAPDLGYSEAVTATTSDAEAEEAKQARRARRRPKNRQTASRSTSMQHLNLDYGNTTATTTKNASNIQTSPLQNRRRTRRRSGSMNMLLTNMPAYLQSNNAAGSSGNGNDDDNASVASCRRTGTRARHRRIASMSLVSNSDAASVSGGRSGMGRERSRRNLMSDRKDIDASSFVTGSRIRRHNSSKLLACN